MVENLSRVCQGTHEKLTGIPHASLMPRQVDGEARSKKKEDVFFRDFLTTRKEITLKNLRRSMEIEVKYYMGEELMTYEVIDSDHCKFVSKDGKSGEGHPRFLHNEEIPKGHTQCMSCGCIVPISWIDGWGCESPGCSY